jgi:hypothetical protein
MMEIDMQNIHKTRFIAANYSNLQGLKGVPIGLLLLLVIIWANRQTGRATDLTLPILFAAGTAVLTWAIYRYYQTRFGQTERTPRQKRLELILGIVGGIFGLGAFVLDTILHLPISLIGLVFAAAVLVEYLRMQWYAPGRYMLPGTLVTFTFMVVVSILPLFGFGNWWLLLGLRAQVFGVLAVVGAVAIVYGLLGHWFFMRQLPARSDRP